jgi:predicted transcriptional regulator
MPTKFLKLGIMGRDEYRNRTIEIAKGTYKPKRDEPHIWFESLQSLAQVLSPDNQELLEIILETKPNSIKELEATTGRKSSNLSRTLHMMEQYGLVDLVRDKTLKPVVKATDFKLEFGLTHSYCKKNKAKEDSISSLLEYCAV